MFLLSLFTCREGTKSVMSRESRFSLQTSHFFTSPSLTRPLVLKLTVSTSLFQFHSFHFVSLYLGKE